MRLTPILLVGLGGALGAIARFLIGQVVTLRFGAAWPWGTFFINMSGCFFIGLFLSYVAARSDISENWRFLFPIGFVGAYTTFSTYAYETVGLVEAGAMARAISYVVASTVCGYAAVVLAIALARRF
jgi:CrcB protein